MLLNIYPKIEYDSGRKEKNFGNKFIFLQTSRIEIKLG